MCTMRRNQQMTPLVLLWLSDLADVCSLLVSLCQPSSWICYNYVIVWYGDVSLTLSFVKFYWTMQNSEAFQASEFCMSWFCSDHQTLPEQENETASFSFPLSTQQLNLFQLCDHLINDVSRLLSFVKFYWTMACFRIIKELSITCHQSLFYRSPSYTRQLDVWAKDWWEWDNLIVFLVKGFYYAKSTTAHNIGLLILTLSLVRVSLHMLFPVIDK